jgi:hypothetical protein
MKNDSPNGKSCYSRSDIRLIQLRIEEEADCVPSTPNEDHDDHVPTPPIGSEPDAKGCSENRDQ